MELKPLPESHFKRMDLIHEEFERRKALGLPYPAWDECPYPPEYCPEQKVA